MRCKVGDLAFIEKLTAEDLRPYLGKIVRCIEPIDHGSFVCWVTEPKIEGGRPVYDGALRPIGDPGDDARDESLSWLPVPSREAEAA